MSYDIYHYDDARDYHYGPDYEPTTCTFQHPALRDDNCGACHYVCIHDGTPDAHLSFLSDVATRTRSAAD